MNGSQGAIEAPGSAMPKIELIFERLLFGSGSQTARRRAWRQWVRR